MNWDLLRLRLAKLAYSLTRPMCWRPLFRGVAPSVEHRDALRRIHCDLILDVGGNRGQFSLLCRMLLPGVSIRAYEPLPAEAAVFRAVHQSSHVVALHEFALGDFDGTAEIHVSGRADSSSLLPIGELQSRLFPQTAEVATAQINVRRLDSLEVHWGAAKSALLKIDVQGFELSVLRGAVKALRRCRWIYVECSEVTLYAGQALRADVEKFLAAEGFQVAGRYNEQFVEGTLIQADYLFRQA